MLCRKSQFSGQTLLEGNALSRTKEKVLKLKVILSMDFDLNKGKRTGDRSCLLGTHGMCAAELYSWEKEEWETNNCITRRVNNTQSSTVYRDQHLVSASHWESQELGPGSLFVGIAMTFLLTPLQDLPGAMSECFSLSSDGSLTPDHKDAAPQSQAPHY